MSEPLTLGRSVYPWTVARDTDRRAVLTVLTTGADSGLPHFWTWDVRKLPAIRTDRHPNDWMHS